MVWIPMFACYLINDILYNVKEATYLHLHLHLVI